MNKATIQLAHKFKHEYDAGLSLRKIAKKYGYSHNYVWLLLKSINVKTRPHKKPVSTAKMRALRKNGLSYREIADRFNMKPSSVYRRLHPKKPIFKTWRDVFVFANSVYHEVYGVQCEDVTGDGELVHSKYRVCVTCGILVFCAHLLSPENQSANEISVHLVNENKAITLFAHRGARSAAKAIKKELMGGNNE